MLLADRIHTSSTESVDFVAIGCLQRGKYGDVTRLQFVRSVRRKATQDDVVSEAELEHFQRLMTSKAITD
jgi:hypothetical protein